MNDVSGSMPDAIRLDSELSDENIKQVKERCKAIGIPIVVPVQQVDIQQDFSWPSHSFSSSPVIINQDPLAEACSLFNKMEGAQSLLDAAKRAYKQHLIEYNISRKDVAEKIKENNKTFIKISDELRKQELVSDFFHPSFSIHPSFKTRSIFNRHFSDGGTA
jgi:hypothetical protein